jgi:hypothetical protein
MTDTTRTSKKKRTPYQRIVRAAKRGTGCRLSADDCHLLGEMDDAIFTRAALDDEDDKLEQQGLPRNSQR